MVNYKCFVCGKKVSSDSMGKRVRCIYCGSKLIFKPRSTPTNVKAR